MAAGGAPTTAFRPGDYDVARRLAEESKVPYEQPGNTRGVRSPSCAKALGDEAWSAAYERGSAR